MDFVHLRCHSNFSLLEGAATVGRLAEAAAGRGMSALALTDTNGLYAAVPFCRAARGRGLKPILGVELTGSLERSCRGARAVVLARSNRGFAEVCRLATARSLEPGFRLAQALAGAAASGEVFVLTGEEDLLRSLASCLPAGGLYVELCPTGETGEAVRTRRLVELSRELGLPLAATANVHFADREDWTLHRLLRAVDLGTTLDGLKPGDTVSRSCWLAGPADMARRLSGLPAEALANTLRIAARCSVELPAGRPIFPEVSLPPGESAYSRLLKAAFRGACRRYRPLRAEVLERLRAELEVIDRLGFAPYFL
ncbi:MAG: PHP domain-containing protein, partial [Candidatus Glassbacteria bacterium]|nr:PHP domain-containing protein [Candidatus Glassbacteria bacterium]